MGARKTIDLDELIKDPELFYKKLYSYINLCLKNYDKRHTKINFIINNKQYNDISMANFVTQMALIIPFIDLNVPFKNKFIIIEEIKRFNKNTLIIYFNAIIHYFNTKIKDHNFINELNISFKKIINIFSDMSGKCNIYSGTTINLRDILMVYKNNENFRKEFDKKVPKRLDFSEIDENINSQFNYLMDILSSNNNCYRPYFIGDAGINKKQFKEVIGKIGLKADLEGAIIPYVINTNYLIGLRNIVDFFIVSKLARKASITSHGEVKKSGYLNRKLELLLIDTILSDEDDCHTDEYIEIMIDGKDTAKRYNFRYFLDEDTNELREFHYSNYKEYLGKTLKFRSPIKCKCKDGHICHTCYGNLYKVNIAIHIGILAELLICEPFTQRLLSAKHLQQVVSDILNWSERFLEYFIIDKGSIICDTSKEKSGLSVIITEDNYSFNEDDEIEINSITLKYKNDKTERVEFPVLLSPTNKLMKYMRDGIKNVEDITISFKSLSVDEEPIFTFILENNELNKSLKQVIDLIDKPDHLGITEVNEFTNKLLQLLNEGNVDLSAVHFELIVRNLIRRACNLTERPERFDQQDDPTSKDYYTILKVSDAVTNSSPAVALSFEKLKQLIQTPTLYTRKGKSILDNLYFG